MTFISFSYFLFLPLTYFVFYITKDRYRWLVLLIASYGFYATYQAPQLILALVLVTAVSYFCGIHLGRTAGEKQRKRTFWIGVIICILLLIGIKLLPFFRAKIAADVGSTYASLLLTIGISYFSFQAISYLTDVYLEIQEPEPHLGYHALALAFFPKLLQGPIERSGSLLPQIKQAYSFSYDNVRSGMVLFAWGLLQKMVIADRLALMVNPVYEDIRSYSSPAILLASCYFSLQIFFEFAGYTDMALGSARLFNIKLTENFNRPYLATSIADFWRRWHISFSSWILDYIFKPLQLQYRNRGRWGVVTALMITFIVSGIWHGVSWGFLAWGCMHGLYMSCAFLYKPVQKKLHVFLGIKSKSFSHKIWQIFFTFTIVTLAWIPFRANNISDALYALSGVALLFFRDLPTIFNFDMESLKAISLGHGMFFLSKIFLSLIIYTGLYKYSRDMSTLKVWYRWSIYSVVVILVLFIGIYNDSSFIYMKF